MDMSVYCEENISKEKLKEIEAEIKKYTGDRLGFIYFKDMTPEKWETFEELLRKRRWILNKLFDFTTENIEKIKKIDDRLRTLTLKLHERVKAMKKKATLIMDDPDFDDDFEIRGTLRFSWNDEDSVKKFDDDEYYGSDFNLMINAIHDFYYEQGKYYTYILDITPDSYNMDDELEDWSEGAFSHPELKICYACHCICSHQLYSISDLIRMNDFWTEIKFIEQSITDAEGNRFKEKD